MSDRSIKEISSELHLKENKVLHNLQRLIDLDLIGETFSNERYTYHINTEAFAGINRETNEEAMFPNFAKEDWEEKVLRNYIKDGRLLSIPTKRKKRDIILNWLVQKFEIGVQYTEKEVNKILLSIYPDVATLRREFIMTKLMNREGAGGSYWRFTESDNKKKSRNN